MSDLAFVLAVVAHTPAWVWGLLTLLIVAGVFQARPRTVGLRRAMLLPLLMLGLSLSAVLSNFASAEALLVWGVCALACASLGLRAGAATGVRWSDARRVFQLPGSWIPLMLMLGIFCLRYGAAVSLALHPAWRESASLALPVSSILGVFSGLFAARAVALWRLVGTQRALIPA